MELYRQILISTPENQKTEVYFPNLKIDAKEIIELTCYKALSQIKAVLEDKSLEDDEYFQKIEEIVCIFERNCGSISYRYDF